MTIDDRKYYLKSAIIDLTIASNELRQNEQRLDLIAGRISLICEANNTTTIDLIDKVRYDLVKGIDNLRDTISELHVKLKNT